MTQRLPPLAALLLLAACGYSQEEYRAEKIEVMCYKMDECGWLEGLKWTLQECLNQTSSDQECVDYDSSAAKECVEAIEEASCEDYSADIGLDACDAVCREADTAE